MKAFILPKLADIGIAYPIFIPVFGLCSIVSAGNVSG